MRLPRRSADVDERFSARSRINTGSDPWLIVKGTGGGSKDNTNNYDFRLKGTGAVHCTRAEIVATGEASCTRGVQQTAHELSNELSRTINADHVEADGPDRSLRRSLRARFAIRCQSVSAPKMIQNRIAKRLPDGWSTLVNCPPTKLVRLTELERAGELTDAVLGLAIAEARMGEA